MIAKVSRATRYYRRNRDICLEKKKARAASIQAAAKRVLSGDAPTCKRCGFDDERALHIDHIAGGGRRERLKKSAQMIRSWIVNHPIEAREKYQLLCANCNCLEAIENCEFWRGRRAPFE